ncbi:MAG: BON domain-containing protein [Acidobacteria bacterium]|nr:BON domain-containing protein [Acidobacteriota bacterium]
MGLRIQKPVRLLFVPALVLSCVTLVAAQTPAEQQSDNTKINRRDRNKSEVTADQQKENRSDRELARDVRRAIVKDKSLSTDAHNVKVVAQDGMVTLKGPVRSDDEKQAVEAKATEVAGENKVKNELHVAAEHGGKPSPNRYR